MSKAKVLFGTIIGAAAGFAAGILTAQKSGKETRAELERKANDVKEEAVVKSKQAKVAAEESIEDVQDTVDSLKDKTKRAAKAAKAELKK